MDSVPPTRTMWESPVSIDRGPIMAASSEEPQRLLTVVAGSDVGSPARRAPIRPTFRLSSPAPLALPHTTSSISTAESKAPC